MTAPDSVSLISPEYPTSEGVEYYNPEPPADQQIQEKQELDKMTASIPVIAEVIADFEKLIAFADSISGLDVESPMPVDSQIKAKQALKKFAEDELEKFKSRYENYQIVTAEVQDE